MIPYKINTVFPHIVSAETILFWLWSYVLWPLMAVHKCAETIQGRKLFKGGNYMRKYGSFAQLVFTFQFFNDEIHNYVLFDIIVNSIIKNWKINTLVSKSILTNWAKLNSLVLTEQDEKTRYFAPKYTKLKFYKSILLLRVFFSDFHGQKDLNLCKL